MGLTSQMASIGAALGADEDVDPQDVHVASAVALNDVGRNEPGAIWDTPPELLEADEAPMWDTPPELLEAEAPRAPPMPPMSWPMSDVPLPELLEADEAPKGATTAEPRKLA